ncbi:unnamed protein product [Rotaria sp. Silwood2]|nr:unnamed protein product [Rotaria sp. Silwood2]
MFHNYLVEMLYQFYQLLLFAIGILIFLIATYTFLLHGNEIRTWTIIHSPLSSKHMNLAAIAYLCLKIPRWYALGVLTGICSLIPILGTAIVWIPITIGLFIQQSYVKAIITIIVGAFGIASIDNLLRPVFF